MPQIAAGQPIEVFVEIDDAQRIERGGVESAIQGHDARTGREQIVGHGFEHGLGEPLVDGAIGHVEPDGFEAGLLGLVEFFGRARRDDDLRLAHQALQTRPFGGAFDQQKNGLGFRRFGHLAGDRHEGLEMLGEAYRLHPFPASRLAGLPQGRPKRGTAAAKIANPQRVLRRDRDEPYITIIGNLRQRQR